MLDFTDCFPEGPTVTPANAESSAPSLSDSYIFSDGDMGFRDDIFEHPGGDVLPLPPAPRARRGGRRRAAVDVPRKKNKIAKGDGRDAKPDPRDGYNYQIGNFFPILARLNGAALTAKVLFPFIEIIARTVPVSVNPNRFAKRRIPNAYCWLDENRNDIPEEVAAQCLSQAKAQVAHHSRHSP
jgi:hypothetical protein